MRTMHIFSPFLYLFLFRDVNKNRSNELLKQSLIEFKFSEEIDAM